MYYTTSVPGDEVLGRNLFTFLRTSATDVIEPTLRRNARQKEAARSQPKVARHQPMRDHRPSWFYEHGVLPVKV